MEKVLIRLNASKPQRYICRITSTLGVIVGIALAISIANRFYPSIFSVWPQAAEILKANGFYIAITFIAFSIVAWNLCLHDWATARERLVITKEMLRREDQIPWLSLATDLWGDFGRRRWKIARHDIEKIVVKVDDADSCAIHVLHSKGREPLFVSAWVYQASENKSGRQQTLGREDSRPRLNELMASPLIKELISHGYPIEFRAVKTKELLHSENMSV